MAQSLSGLLLQGLALGFLLGCSHPAEPVFMELALEEAKKASALGFAPVGAVLVAEGAVLARAHNQILPGRFFESHAEELVLEEALRIRKAQDFGAKASDVRLYVTYEPCVVCAARLVSRGVTQVTYARPKQTVFARHLLSFFAYWHGSQPGPFRDEAEKLWVK
jgi:tRNA(Arg) A34 adenosine deaminase TadA